MGDLVDFSGLHEAPKIDADEVDAVELLGGRSWGRAMDIHRGPEDGEPGYVLGCVVSLAKHHWTLMNL